MANGRKELGVKSQHLVWLTIATALSAVAAVIPGFKRGAAVVWVGCGRGFIWCRNGENWSVQARSRWKAGAWVSRPVARPSAWVNGKSAHTDPSARILFYGHKGAHAGFGLDGATVKPDESGDKACMARG